ncbi:hypothetical protein [Micromonospora sp. RTGN7]|uniref:hypothetical protein n=1 Tax=Micromonospora sp. RTGN7 TaxID=3016526 RepID=UPI0029FED65B|nr:hypothetical protein [Micromonospora sp. RTGN7]
MTRSIRGSRRAALLLSGVAATGLLATGCGAGQVAETANKEPSILGVNSQTPDNAYKVRGLYVEYPGVEGYKSGANATVNAVVYNDTRSPVTLTVTTDGAREIVITGASGSASPSPSTSESPSESASPSASTSPSGSASPSESGSPSPSEGAAGSPSASASPSAPAGEPARVEIPAFSYVQLNVEGDRSLQLVGLNETLLVGHQVNLTFDFGNGKVISTAAPVGVPLTPLPQPSPIVEREGAHAEEGGTEAGAGHGG